MPFVRLVPDEYHPPPPQRLRISVSAAGLSNGETFPIWQLDDVALVSAKEAVPIESCKGQQAGVVGEPGGSSLNGGGAADVIVGN